MLERSVADGGSIISDRLPFEVALQKDAGVTMRDGVILRADVYRPALSGRLLEDRRPTILVRTPFDKSERPNIHIEPDRFVGAGYVVVLQDVRGRHASQGRFYHGVSEVDDAYDTLDWIAAQSWSDGRVGMTGISYVAAVQCAAACSGTSRLKSLFHVEGPMDYYRHGFRNHGAFRQYIVPTIFSYAATSKESSEDPVVAKSLSLACAQAVDWIKRLPLKKGHNPLSETPDLERWLLDIATHEDYDDFWSTVPLWQVGEFLDEYLDIPGYYVGGWYDMYREDLLFTELATRIQGPIRLLMGPWVHGEFRRAAGDVDFGPDAELSYDDFMSMQLDWFDRTLRDTPYEGVPPVKVFVMGGGSGEKTAEGRLSHGGQWRFENEWPLARTDYDEFHFHPDGSLSTRPPGPECDGSSTSFLYDPRDPVPTIGGTEYFSAERDAVSGEWKFVIPYGPYDQRERADVFACRTTLPLASRHDVVVFEMEPLSADLEVTGLPRVHLWLSTSVRDTDIVVKLIDVYPKSAHYPDGYALNVSQGCLRMRYRNGFRTPQWMEPDEVVRCMIELTPTSNCFKKGHRVRLMVASSDYPAIDPNPNTGRPVDEQEPIVAKNTIHHSPSYPSHIVLPIIPIPASDRLENRA